MVPVRVKGLEDIHKGRSEFGGSGILVIFIWTNITDKILEKPPISLYCVQFRFSSLKFQQKFNKFSNSVPSIIASLHPINGLKQQNEKNPNLLIFFALCHTVMYLKQSLPKKGTKKEKFL